MNIKYNHVSLENIQRILFIGELRETKNLLDKIRRFSYEIANSLDSKIEKETYYDFPSDLNNIKNYTYLAVLSTSHIAISTYIDNKGAFIDIDLVWCSKKILPKEKLIEIYSKYFGRPNRYIYKKYNYKGDLLEYYDEGFLNR